MPTAVATRTRRGRNADAICCEVCQVARSSVSPVRAELVGAYAVDVCSAPAQLPLDAAINVRSLPINAEWLNACLH